jgi:hypothetical protein
VHSLAKACFFATLCLANAHGQSVKPGADLFTPATVQAAVETLRHDPNLNHDTTVRSLHWVAGAQKPPPKDAPAWIVSLFLFLTQSASLVVWVAGAAGLAFAAVWAYRLARGGRSAPCVAALQSVSRVQDLDIDPNSLPADVGSAALGLMHAGRAREALSLLYRGALSRMVHRFSVVVGESFTEGEALRAARQGLEQPQVRYFAALVALWQRVVYAAEAPAAESVTALCREFAPTFDGAPVL